MRLIALFSTAVILIGITEIHARGNRPVALIIEPTASHISGYLDVLMVRDGVASVAVAVEGGDSNAAAVTAALANAKAKLGERFYGEDGFRDAGAMLAAVKPELTVVTMEGRNAPAAIRMALEAGSHVLTEKPSCTKLEQFDALARLAEEKKLHLMLAMSTRSGAAFKKARQLIVEEGAIGKPYSVSMVWVADQTRLSKPAYHGSWMADPERAGGGKLIYHGVHYLDVIQHLLDDPIREITGFTGNVGGQPIGVEDSAVVSFRFAKSGATGTHNTGYYLDSGKQSEIRIWGSHGWLRLDHLGGKPMEWVSWKTEAERKKGVQTFEYDDARLMYHLFFQDAIDAVRLKKAPPITTVESLRALRVVFSAYEAVETGKTQKIE